MINSLVTARRRPLGAPRTGVLRAGSVVGMLTMTPSPPRVRRRELMPERLEVVFEVLFSMQAATDAENVRWRRLRIQFHIVARPVPDISRIRQ